MDQLEDKDPFGLSRLDDPEFEAIERARLTISDEGDVPSAEIQEAFVAHVNNFQAKNRLPGKFDIRPDKLFYSYLIKNESGEFFNRYYYKYPTAKNFSGNDIQVRLTFTKRPHLNNYVKIEKFGEGPSFTGIKTESFEVTFIPPYFETEGDINFDQISLTAKFNERELSIHYERQGDISAFNLEPTNYRDGLLASSRGRQDISIEQLLENGEGTFQSGNNIYRTSYDKEGEIIRLERLVDGELQDTILIPRHLDGSQKFDELFPKPLRDNLNNADPDEDRTWKDINLQTFGVTWEMPSANPTS